MPSPSEGLAKIKQYLLLTVVPVVAGAVTNWIVVHAHFLAAFHVGANTVALAVSQVLTFAVGAGLAWLAAHKILQGAYSQQAKELAGRR